MRETQIVLVSQEWREGMGKLDLNDNRKYLTNQYFGIFYASKATVSDYTESRLL